MFDGILHKGLDCQNRKQAGFRPLLHIRIQKNGNSSLQCINLADIPDLLDLLLHRHQFPVVSEHISEMSGQGKDHISHRFRPFSIKQGIDGVQTVEKKMRINLKLIILELCSIGAELFLILLLPQPDNISQHPLHPLIDIVHLDNMGHFSFPASRLLNFTAF